MPTGLPRRSGVSGASVHVADGQDTNVGALGAGAYGVNLVDDAASQGIILHLDHAATAAQAYALDIRNRDGARTALVIHQYSAVEPAVWIDNTDTKAAIRINNTSNAVFNPDGSPQGDFFEFQDAGTTKLRFTYQHTFLRTDSGKVTFLNTGTGIALSVQTSHNSASCFQIIKSGAGAATACEVDNRGTGRSILVQASATTKFAIDKDGIPEWLNGGSNEQTTVGAAGAASALPATPTAYLKVKNNAGTTLVIPAYAAA